MSRILFDNVIKDAQHIYDWGNLELEDQQRMQSIIDVLKLCQKKDQLLMSAEKEIKRYENIFNRMITGDVWMTFDEDPVIAYKELAKHALKPIPTANKE